MSFDTKWIVLLLGVPSELVMGQSGHTSNLIPDWNLENPEYPTEDDDNSWWSCLDELSCSEVSELGPPPTMNVPPPPLPSFMEDILKTIEDIQEPCKICDWAHSNFTEDIDFTIPPAEPVQDWVTLLVAVALISAVLGAITMVCILRCCRSQFLSVFSWCPFGIGKGSQRGPSPVKANPPKRTFPTSIWRRTSSQEETLRTPTSESISEDPYTIPGERDSVIYAELNSQPSSDLDSSTYRAPSQNTYTEIPDPSLLGICIAGDATYENAGYVLSEPPAEMGSSSTGSSAYYSDNSVSISRTNGSKWGKGPQLPPTTALPTISASVPIFSCREFLSQQSDVVPALKTDPLDIRTAIHLLPRTLKSRETSLSSQYV